MKPTFRETADRQLAEMKFTESMRLSVLVQGRRRHVALRRSLIAVACALVLLLGFVAYRFALPGNAPDTVAAYGQDGALSFSSPRCRLAITSVRWEGYWLTIEYTLTSTADESVLMVRSPFTADDDALIEDTSGAYFKAYAEEALCLQPGETLCLTARLRIENCAPGQTLELRLRADLFTPAIEISIPEDLLTNAEGPFLVKLDEHRVDIISAARGSKNASAATTPSECVEYIDYPTSVWTSTADRSYATLPGMLVNDGIAAEYEKLGAYFFVTVPGELTTQSMIRSGATAGNGLFSVEIDDAVFSPDSTAFSIIIRPEKPLLRKEARKFYAQFSSADGALCEKVELTPYILPASEASSANLICYYDGVLGFAPANVTIICEWSDGDISGTAEAVFADASN